jgi:predicted RNase H-like HicB family nuclease
MKQQKTADKYSFNIAWSEEDGEFVATCPAFPGLSALGETEMDALAEAKTAVDLFIRTYQAKGIRLPEPNVIQEYSGQTRLRLPKSLHQLAAKLAELDGVSLNQFIVDALRERATTEQVRNQHIRAVERRRAELNNTVTLAMLPVMPATVRLPQTTLTILDFATERPLPKKGAEHNKGN